MGTLAAAAGSVYVDLRAARQSERPTAEIPALAVHASHARSRFASRSASAAVGVFANAIGGESTGMVFGEDANSVICDEMMASIASTRSQDYSQCVSDLFGP